MRRARLTLTSLHQHSSTLGRYLQITRDRGQVKCANDVIKWLIIHALDDESHARCDASVIRCTFFGGCSSRSTGAIRVRRLGGEALALIRSASPTQAPAASLTPETEPRCREAPRSSARSPRCVAPSIASRR